MTTYITHPVVRKSVLKYINLIFICKYNLITNCIKMCVQFQQQDMINLGCRNQFSVGIAFQVYMDLCEGIWNSRNLLPWEIKLSDRIY